MEYVEKMKNLLVDALKKAVDFKGRINCPDFWWTVLSLVIISIPVGIILLILNLIPIVGTLITFVYQLAIMAIMCSLAARRLNDVKGPVILAFIMVGLEILGALFSMINGFMMSSWQNALYSLIGGGFIWGTLGMICSLLGVVAFIAFIYFAIQPSKE